MKSPAGVKMFKHISCIRGLMGSKDSLTMLSILCKLSSSWSIAALDIAVDLKSAFWVDGVKGLIFDCTPFCGADLLTRQCFPEYGCEEHNMENRFEVVFTGMECLSHCKANGHEKGSSLCGLITVIYCGKGDTLCSLFCATVHHVNPKVAGSKWNWKCNPYHLEVLNDTYPSYPGAPQKFPLCQRNLQEQPWCWKNWYPCAIFVHPIMLCELSKAQLVNYAHARRENTIPCTTSMKTPLKSFRFTQALRGYVTGPHSWWQWVCPTAGNLWWQEVELMMIGITVPLAGMLLWADTGTLLSMWGGVLVLTGKLLCMWPFVVATKTLYQLWSCGRHLPPLMLVLPWLGLGIFNKIDITRGGLL